MSERYVENRDGGYWVKGTRVSLDSIVHSFRRGSSPESIMQSFPLLTLEQVYGALTYYLAHQSAIDSYLTESESRFQIEERDRRKHPASADLFHRLRNAEAVVK